MWLTALFPVTQNYSNQMGPPQLMIIQRSAISMASCMTSVTPLLTHWSYFSLTLSHRYDMVWFRYWTRSGLYIFTFYVYSFNNPNLIFADFPTITSQYVFNETISVVLTGMSVKFRLYGLRFHFVGFMTASLIDVQLLPWLTEYTHLTQFNTL